MSEIKAEEEKAVELPLFSYKAFEKSRFEPRVEKVFINNEDENGCYISVRALTAAELVKVELSANHLDAKTKFLESYEGVDDVVNLMKSVIGEDNEVSEAYARKLEMVHLGVVAPPMLLTDLVNFAQHRPADFNLLFLKIRLLTTKGSKKKP